MKVICPKCEASIAANYTNKSKGLAYCNHCRDFFRLDVHWTRDPYFIRREARFIKKVKPSKTKIEVEKTPQGWTINVPDGLPMIVRFILMIFLVALAYALYQTITVPGIIDLEFYLQVGALILLNFFLILAIVLKGPKTILTLDHDNIRLHQKRSILPSYSRNRKTNHLDTIDIYHDSDNDSGSSSGIEMTFVSEASLRLGSNLSMDEQEWLAGQFIFIRDELTLDDEVTKDIPLKIAKAKNNPVIITSTKPSQSNISISDKTEVDTVVIPKDRKIGNALLVVALYLIGMSIFAIVAIGFWGFIPSFFEHDKIMKYVFSCFTILASYGLFYYLYTFIYRARHQISINAKEIKVELYPFGILLEKNRPTKALIEIARSREWKCVLLKFNGHKDLRVGFSLSKEELNFLIGKLKKMTNEVNEKSLELTQKDKI